MKTMTWAFALVALFPATVFAYCGDIRDSFERQTCQEVQANERRAWTNLDHRVSARIEKMYHLNPGSLTVEAKDDYYSGWVEVFSSNDGRVLCQMIPFGAVFSVSCNGKAAFTVGL